MKHSKAQETFLQRPGDKKTGNTVGDAFDSSARSSRIRTDSTVCALTACIHRSADSESFSLTRGVITDRNRLKERRKGPDPLPLSPNFARGGSAKTHWILLGRDLSRNSVQSIQYKGQLTYA